MNESSMPEDSLLQIMEGRQHLCKNEGVERKRTPIILDKKNKS